MTVTLRRRSETIDEEQSLYALGCSEAEFQHLEQQGMFDEAVAANSCIMLPPLVGAWTRTVPPAADAAGARS